MWICGEPKKITCRFYFKSYVQPIEPFLLNCPLRYWTYAKHNVRAKTKIQPLNVQLAASYKCISNSDERHTSVSKLLVSSPCVYLLFYAMSVQVIAIIFLFLVFSISLCTQCVLPLGHVRDKKKKKRKACKCIAVATLNVACT